MVRIDAFQRKLLGFQPENRSQEILHAETLRQFDGFVEVRRERIHAVSSGLPTVMWWVLLVGGVIGIGLTCLLSIRRPSLHLALAGSLSLVTGMVVFLLVALDHPLRGGVRITPEAFEIIQKNLMTTGSEGRLHEITKPGESAE